MGGGSPISLLPPLPLFHLYDHLHSLPWHWHGVRNEAGGSSRWGRKKGKGCLAAERDFLGLLVKAALPGLIWLTERDAPSTWAYSNPRVPSGTSIYLCLGHCAFLTDACWTEGWGRTSHPKLLVPQSCYWFNTHSASMVPTSALSARFLPPLGPWFYLHRGFPWFLAFWVLLTSSWCLGIAKAQFKDEKANSLCLSSFPLTPFGSVLFCVSDSVQMVLSRWKHLIL